MLINPSGKVLPCHAAEVLARNVVRERAGENAGVDLAGVFFVPALSRRRLDAGALPKLRSPHRRLRRLPLPGISAGRRTPLATDPACSLAPAHAIVESAVREANSDMGVAQAKSASSFVQLQRETSILWDYRINPE